MDYNSSVLRKEKDIFFVRIASDFYDGDNRLKIEKPKMSNFSLDSLAII